MEDQDQQDSAIETLDDDIMLHTFVRAAFEGQLSMGITLNVPGTVVSGVLIGRNEWLELFEAWLAEAGDTTMGPALSEGVVRISQEAEEARGYPLFGYIHLKDARFLVGENLMPNRGRGLLWRGKLSEVSAWSLGQFGSSQTS